MKGIPAYLNAKNDYLNIKENFPSSQWQPLFQKLLDEKDSWMNTGIISDGSGITDDTHKVVENEGVDDEIEKYQFEYKEDSRAKIFRLDFTVEEIQNYLNEA